MLRQFLTRSGHPVLLLFVAAVVLLLAGSVLGQSKSTPKGYLDYLDSYYQTGDANDLSLARNSIKTELDASAALRFQGYFYNAEIQYLLALEQLKRDPKNVDMQEKLRSLLLQLYTRYLDAYYKIDEAQLQTSNVPGNTAFLFKDITMAATFIPNSNSWSPLVKNVLRRANREGLYDRDNSYVASVNDMLELEYPNLFGVSNLVKSVWLNDKFIGMQNEGPAKDSLRQMVNYYAAIGADTLKSAYGRTIAYFLLAETYAGHENDMAWDYFKKCLSTYKAESVEPKGFYAKNYNREIYLATAVAFLPKYAEYLYDAGRHSEVLMGAKFLVDSGMLDRGKTENVSKEAVFWGEKSLRALQDAGRFASADEIFQQLQDFNELLDPNSQYGGSTQGTSTTKPQ